MKKETANAPPKPVIEGEHLIGKFTGRDGEATLIAVGSIHGNEPGGATALRNIFGQLENLREKLRGRIYFLAGNTRALTRGVRFMGADLNRHWTRENIARNRSDFPPATVEDYEQSELLRIFDEILTTAKGEVYALDLHSTSAAGLPFATVGDTMRNRRFARKFPVRVLLGIEEQLDGTMLEYLNNEGAVTLGFEGGQHESAEAIINHEALIWLALVNSGILAPEDLPDLEKYRKNLAATTGKMRFLEVRYREAITPEDEFEMNPGFENFASVKRGQVLARNKRGEIKAPESGLILMPLYQKQGEDGFFVGREIASFWLWLSGVLRRLKIGDFIRILPGVRTSPTDHESLIVDTRVARFFPLQIFHLLGFRKRRMKENQLIVSRRRHDRESPFRDKRS